MITQILSVLTLTLEFIPQKFIHEFAVGLTLELFHEGLSSENKPTITSENPEMNPAICEYKRTLLLQTAFE